MRRYFRYRNDPKRFKPLITVHDSSNGPYFVVSATAIDEKALIKTTYDFTEAIEQANAWADEYRAAWVAANMKAA